MTNSRQWLPDLLRLNDYNGWDSYVEVLYRHFKVDFINSYPLLYGVRVSFKRHPMYEGKVATFWHLISRGKIEEDRLPDMRRCERIRWIRRIIEHCDEDCIKVWENTRPTGKRIILWMEEEDYLVVLAKGNGYRLLLTAYMVTQKHRKRKLQREYERYILTGSAAP